MVARRCASRRRIAADAAQAVDTPVMSRTSGRRAAGRRAPDRSRCRRRARASRRRPEGAGGRERCGAFKAGRQRSSPARIAGPGPRLAANEVFTSFAGQSNMTAPLCKHPLDRLKADAPRARDPRRRSDPGPHPEGGSRSSSCDTATAVRRFERISRTGEVERPDDLLLLRQQGSALHRGAGERLHRAGSAPKARLVLDESRPVEALRTLIAFTWDYYLAHPEFVAPAQQREPAARPPHHEVADGEATVAAGPRHPRQESSTKARGRGSFAPISTCAGST